MENKVANSEEKKETGKRTGRKIILWIMGILLICILIAIGIATWLCATLFDEKPLQIINNEPDYSQYKSCIKKFKIKPKDGESLEDALMKDKTVDLSKDEVNAVLDSLTFGARGYLAVKLPNTTLSDLRFENAALHAKVSQKSAFSTPFGDYMNMTITITPRIENNHLYLDVRNLSVGSMTLSGDWVQKYIDTDLKQFEKTDDGQMIVTMLKGLQLEKNSVKVTFNPMQVNMFVMQKALSIFSNGDGGDLSDMLKLLK
jgi:uncharacterized protein YpmS